MTLPSFIISVLIGLLIGALFHVLLDGGGGRLVLYLILGLTGFFAGQVVGTLLNWSFIPVGPLDLGMATIGSLLCLGIGHWLSLIEIDRPGGSDRL